MCDGGSRIADERNSPVNDTRPCHPPVMLTRYTARVNKVCTRGEQRIVGDIRWSIIMPLRFYERRSKTKAGESNYTRAPAMCNLN